MLGILERAILLVKLGANYERLYLRRKGCTVYEFRDIWTSRKTENRLYNWLRKCRGTLN
jgi:hypothetical protein